MSLATRTIHVPTVVFTKRPTRSHRSLFEVTSYTVLNRTYQMTPEARLDAIRRDTAGTPSRYCDLQTCTDLQRK